MKRRDFIATAGLGAAAAATTIAAPAIAQSAPDIKWRLTSSFPKSLDTIYGAAEDVSKHVAAITDNKFQIQVFAAGEIVPGLQALDAVQEGSVEACHTASYYYVGKDPTFAFGTAIPFGLNCRQQNAWMHQRRRPGADARVHEGLQRRLHPVRQYRRADGRLVPQGDQVVADLNGLKMRIGGFAGKVLTKLGVVPQQLAGGDIYPALEKGTIDAAEWVGPYDDEKLGFNKVAPFYYYPGWWEGGPMLLGHAEPGRVGQAAAELQGGARSRLRRRRHRHDGEVRRQQPGGAEAPGRGRHAAEAVPGRGARRPATRRRMELYDETAAANPKFKKVYDAWKPFRDEQFLWFRIAEGVYDSFTFSAADRVKG